MGSLRSGGRGTVHDGAQPGVPPGPCGPGGAVAWGSLLLGGQDGEGLVDFHHGDDEEAAGQQEGGPEQREEKGLRPVEAPVQDAGLVLPRHREAQENAVLVESVSDGLHVGPGRLVVVQAAWDVGALWGEARAPVGLEGPVWGHLEMSGWPGAKENTSFGVRPLWESELSRAWWAGHCTVLEGVFRVLFVSLVALELLRGHTAHLEAGVLESWLCFC